MSTKNVVEDLRNRAISAVRHPAASAGYVVGVAKGAVKYGASTATSVVRAIGSDTPAPAPAPAPTPPPPGAFAEPEPEPVPVAESDDEAFTTEPKASSRVAEHGGQDAEELDGWQAEVIEERDVETPVGTTGVAPGVNPDTGETDLQQPGTEPLMDPSLTKAVKSETDMMRKGADRDQD